jgi:hypothetical protein
MRPRATASSINERAYSQRSGRAVADRPHPRHHLIPRHAVLAPGAAAGAVVVQHRLQSIERRGEAGLGRGARLELVPQAAQLSPEVVGQQGEESVGGAALALALVEHGGLVVAEGVAGVDLDQVVDQHHLQHARQVDPGRGVLRQQHRHHRQVPGVLGRVLAPRAVEDPGPAAGRS